MTKELVLSSATQDASDLVKKTPYLRNIVYGVALRNNVELLVAENGEIPDVPLNGADLKPIMFRCFTVVCQLLLALVKHRYLRAKKRKGN